MAASANDKFMYVGEPGTATTLSAPGYTIGNASINVGSTSNFPTSTGVIFGIDTATVVNGQEERVENTYCVFAGTVTNGTTIGNLTLLNGTPQNYAASSLTRVYITTSSMWARRLVEGLTAEHNQLDGTHDASKVAMLAGTQTFTGTKTFSTAPVVPANSFNQTKLNLSKTTDANGWTVYDYGNWKVYKKRVTASVSKTSGEVFSITSTNLPTGVSTIGTNFADYSLHLSTADGLTYGSTSGTTSTSITVTCKVAAAGGPYTFSGFVDFELHTS